MIAGLLLILYILLISWLTGLVFQSVIVRVTRDTIFFIHPVITTISGLATLGVLLQISHLFIPINHWVHVGIWIIIGIFLIIEKRSFHTNTKLTFEWFYTKKWFGLWALVLLLVALLNLVGRAGVGDIADYHLQAIQWNEKYTVINGLGNLRRQLGNNSNWFLLHAFSGFSFLELKSAYILNTVLFLLAGVYFYPYPNRSNAILKGFILVYVVLMAFRKYVGAVTNDYPITIITLIVFTEWLENKQENIRSLFILFWIILILPTFKLSAIGLLCILPWYIYKQWKEQAPLKHFFLLFALLVIIYLPWIITNYFQSGYLVYPIEFTGFLHPEWQMNPSVLQFERNINIANERIPGMPVSEVLNYSFSQWFPIWLIKLDFFSKLLLLLFSGSVFFQFIRLVTGKINLRNSLFSAKGILLITIMAGMTIWFLNAPATRFVFGYLVFFIGLNLQIIFAKSRYHIRIIHIRAACLLILCITGGIFMIQYLPKAKLLEQLKTPQPYSNQIMQKVKIGNGFINRPGAGEQCWDSPLPCSSEFDSTLQWRSPNPEDGFSIK